MQSDKPEEECGVIGIWNTGGGNRNTGTMPDGRLTERENRKDMAYEIDSAEIVYLGMYGIQHRGQQSAGIAIQDNGKIICHRELGLVAEVFDEVVLKHLRHGKAGLGGVGYSRSEENVRENVQPLIIRYSKGQMGITYNGCLINSRELREELEQNGHILQTSGDAEIIAALISRERVRHHSIEDAIVQVMKKIKGAYSFLVMTPHKLIAVRDPSGMKPLCMGTLEGATLFASESCALDTVSATLIRDVLPGEIVVVTDNGVQSIYNRTAAQTAMCIFEFVYLARTDSVIDGVDVYASRYEAGKILAREAPVDADLVIGVPDSAIPAALGFSAESQIPYAEGLIRNRYIGRTFIQPSQDIRERQVGLKLNALAGQIRGKRIVLVDDSIVRGTTTKKTVQMLKDRGGAREVHMRLSSPPVLYPCRFGIDTEEKDMLIANRMSFEEIRRLIGADSLAFISQEGLLRTPLNAKCGFCSACFNGKYPLDVEIES